MLEIHNTTTSISNPATMAATKIALSQASTLSTSMGERQWQSNKSEVGLLHKVSCVQHPLCSLNVNEKPLCIPPRCGLSHFSTPLKMYNLDHVPPVVKLWDKGNPVELVDPTYRKWRITGEEMSTRQPQTRTSVSGGVWRGLPACPKNLVEPLR